MLDSLITSKTRLRLLVKFFVNANNHSHLRGLAEEFGESTNAIRKELNHLSQAGYLHKEAIKDRKSTRLNSSHVRISYAVFCLKKKKKKKKKNSNKNKKIIKKTKIKKNKTTMIVKVVL